MDNRIRIACSKNNLKDIRAFVTNTLRNLHVPELEINMIVLAVDEVCANRIIHSNHNDDKSYLDIEINKENANLLLFKIVDEGEPFDHKSYVEPNLDQLIKEKKKGGLGLMLVKKIMDSFEITKEDNHTVCMLKKSLKTY